ncbi:CynX/NimT family MFS transporter [Klenkia brasiliensis]|uniref:MFS transporter, CP family, cyanate transporter n=1 Tax=Klenkia brasiliensis TaxID=333142 RepID=A0A1G7QP79_9ACTN|nr:MFS transporter [Klenkia brasiliensis]SDG00312.1 MFS transporter, CP family, cyanate transporter [Klenkia brasiliensis]
MSTALAPARTRGRLLLVLVAVVVVALNQRPALVGVAPLLGDLRADTGLSSALAGLLTALPVLCFGAFAPVAPQLARRVGLGTAVAASLVLLAAGTALRLLPPVTALYAGTVVAGGAIAVANVLVPAYVKREFAEPGLVMGVYSAALNVGAALAAGLTVPLGLALGWGWRGALASWGLLAVLALAVWLPVAGTGRADRAGASPGTAWGLLRHGLAWRVTLFLGMQSTQFYGLSAWLPTLLVDAGLPVAEAGLLLAVTTVTGAVGAFLGPTLAGRLQLRGRGQRPLVGVVLACYVVGLTGLLVSPEAGTVVWVSLFGVAQGGGFALGLTLVVLRSATPLTAARMGGVAQCLGYLVASLGPVVLGALHDLTGGWSWSVGLLLALLVPMAWAGWGAARAVVLPEDAARA